MSMLLLLLGLAPAVFAQTTYYVAANGNDGNSGRSADSPLQSLAKVSSLTLQAGDQVLLRRGDTFRGTLYVRQSGSSGSPIVVDAYGSGNKPVIAGSTLVTGWNNIGNNTWQASCPSCGSRVTGAYRDNTALPLGRYPNLSDSNKGYLTIQSHNGRGQITSQQSLSTNWAGGDAVVRSATWVIDRVTIANQNGNTLSLAGSTTYEPTDGWGYFVQNHPATLDQSGEWYYNPADKTIRLYDNQNNPNNQSIAVTTASEGVNLANVNNVTVRNIKVTQTLSSGILSVNGNGITVSGNDITNSGENAVFFNGSGSGITLENNLLEDANSSGLTIQAFQNFTFRGNTVQRIGLVPGRGANGDGSYSGLQSSCTNNSLIEYNVFDNIGYTGVSVVTSSTVQYNRVSNYCMTKSDGGGLYTWNGNRNNTNGLRFLSNIIYNGVGAPEGAPINATTGAHGIFLDDCTVNAEVSGNSIFRVAGMGIFLRGAYSNTLKNNTLFDNGEEQIKIVANQICTPRNITSQNNIFASKLATQLVAAYESSANDLSQYGSFDYNYYMRPFEDQFKIQAVYNPGSGLTGQRLSLAEWQNKYGQDRNSFNSPITYKTQMVTQTGTTLLNFPYSGNINGWGVWSPYGNGRADWDNANKLDGGSMKLSFASSSGKGDSYLLATINLGSVRKGQTYQLLLDGIASGANKRLTVYPRQQAGNYRDLADRTTFVLGTNRQNLEATFTANADESNAILVVQAYEDGQTVWVDNLLMREATLSTLNPDDYVKIVYNASNQTTNVGLDGTYRDAKNTAYTGQITLAPYTSALLFKQTSTTTTPTPTPTPVSLRDPENPASTTNGLDYQYYEGSWTSLPNFASLTPAKTGAASTVDFSMRGREQNYGLRFTGYINVPTDGTYTFYTTSDDGTKLYIGTTEVVSNDGVHGDQEQSGTIGLKAGKHAITIIYFQGVGGQSLSASYSGPNINKQAIPASTFFRVPTTTTTPTPTPTPSGSGVYLSDLTWTSATNGYGPVEKDKSNGESGAGDGRTVTLNGQTYAKGLGVHAASSISYNLGGQYTQFITDVGLDDEIANSGCGTIEFQVFVDGNKVYSSGTMNAATATKSITLDVSGKQTLTLVVTDGGDGVSCDHGDWAGARLIPSSTTPVTSSSLYLSDLTWSSASNGYGPVEKDKSNGEANAGDGRTITLNGQTYTKGLGIHAASSISYNLGGQYTQFITDMGLDDEIADAGCGNVEFQVFLDGNKVYSSGNMNAATATKSLTLDVSGKQTLTLVVTDGGDGAACDHGDWAGARLAKASNSRIAATVQPEAGLFTAEVYPNPAHDMLKVRYWAAMTGDLSLQLLNQAGQPMIRQLYSVTAGENLINVPVQEIPRGFYILSLIQGQQRVTSKVILAE